MGEKFSKGGGRGGGSPPSPSPLYESLVVPMIGMSYPVGISGLQDVQDSNKNQCKN